MGLRRTRRRLRLLAAGAVLAGCLAASLGGSLAAFAHARPMARAPSVEIPAPRPEVVTIGMMMAQHPPV